jgi:hypothetical protein
MPVGACGGSKRAGGGQVVISAHISWGRARGGECLCRVRVGVPQFLSSAVQAGITLNTSGGSGGSLQSGITKRCRLSLLTNSAPVIRV